jgi:hypothetical protein
MAAEDLGSKPMIKMSIGTKIPPPPSPPMLPSAAPKNPMNDPNTICHPNFMGYIQRHDETCQITWHQN